MDAILHEARLLGGDASIESEQGRGTTLIIEVPDQSLQDVFQVSA
jgi:chemotaxis protein histidine kinase CheA